MEVKLLRTRKKEIHTSIPIGWQDWWPWQLPIIRNSQRSWGGNLAIWGLLPRREKSRGLINRRQGSSCSWRNHKASNAFFQILQLHAYLVTSCSRSVIVSWFCKKTQTQIVLSLSLKNTHTQRLNHSVLRGNKKRRQISKKDKVEFRIHFVVVDKLRAKEIGFRQGFKRIRVQ